VGFISYNGSKQLLIVGRIVFQISVLNDHDVDRCLTKTGSKRRAFILVTP
jgi:hypothetical protein